MLHERRPVVLVGRRAADLVVRRARLRVRAGARIDTPTREARGRQERAGYPATRWVAPPPPPPPPPPPGAPPPSLPPPHPARTAASPDAAKRAAPPIDAPIDAPVLGNGTVTLRPPKLHLVRFPEALFLEREAASRVAAAQILDHSGMAAGVDASLGRCELPLADIMLDDRVDATDLPGPAHVARIVGARAGRNETNARVARGKSRATPRRSRTRRGSSRLRARTCAGRRRALRASSAAC